MRRALPVVDAFLAAAEGAEQQRAEREAARQRELAANRKFRRLFLGMTVVALPAIAATLWGGWQTHQACQAGDRADPRAREATAAERRAQQSAEAASRSERLAEQRARDADHRPGLLFTEKARGLGGKASPTRQHLYHFHAIAHLDPSREPDVFERAVLDARRSLPHDPISTSPGAPARWPGDGP